MARERRSDNLGLEFDEHANVRGWFFAVPDAFKDALDIKFTPRTTKEGKNSVWTRGVPPVYSFDLGDVFYDHPLARSKPWGDTPVRYAAQVVESIPCAVMGDHVSEGEVNFELLHYENGTLTQREVLPKTTQTAFAEFLQTGVLPGQLDLRGSKNDEA